MTGTASPDLVVGVYDEPDLIVVGVQTMLRWTDTRGSAYPLTERWPWRRVDVVLCDPLRDGIDLEPYLTRVRDLGKAPIVAFSWSPRPHRVRRVLDAGVSAFVAKQSSAAELVAVLAHAAVEGPAPLVPRLVGEQPVSLDDREAAVLHLICQGLSNEEIAASLFVSVNSVKTWVRQVYRRIGVTRRPQAVAWGVERHY